MKKRIFYLLLIALFILSGCAAGQRIEYRGLSDFNIPYGMDSIALGLHDQRPYVVNGNKKPNFVGLSKSIYGIPFNVETTSGNSLSDDFSLLIKESLENSNAESVTVVSLTPFISKDESKKRILGITDSVHHILITINQWKTETHFRSGLFYDLSLDVIDSNGDVIVNSHKKGFEFLNKDTPGRENLASAVVDIIGSLFNDKNVQQHLKKVI